MNFKFAVPWLYIQHPTMKHQRTKCSSLLSLLLVSTTLVNCSSYFTPPKISGKYVTAINSSGNGKIRPSPSGVVDYLHSPADERELNSISNSPTSPNRKSFRPVTPRGTAPTPIRCPSIPEGNENEGSDDEFAYKEQEEEDVPCVKLPSERDMELEIKNLENLMAKARIPDFIVEDVNDSDSDSENYLPPGSSPKSEDKDKFATEFVVEPVDEPIVEPIIEPIVEVSYLSKEKQKEITDEQRMVIVLSSVLDGALTDDQVFDTLVRSDCLSLVLSTKRIEGVLPLDAIKAIRPALHQRLSLSFSNSVFEGLQNALIEKLKSTFEKVPSTQEDVISRLTLLNKIIELINNENK